MTVPTTMLPSLGQWRLINLLAIRAAFSSTRTAARMLYLTNCDPSDLGELAEEGWVTGRDAAGDDVNLAGNWSHSLAYVYLSLTGKGLAWATGSPHNTLLFEIADAQGAYRMKPAEVKDREEVMRQLRDRDLITVETETGRSLEHRHLLSRQAPDEVLYVRLTQRGRSIVNP